MRKMRFNEKWIQLIMQCVETVSYSVVVNGKAGERFFPTKGLRQGDLLYPYLFIMKIKGLCSLLSNQIKK